MPDVPDRTFLRAFFRNLQDRPLDLSDEKDQALYQQLHEEESDPVNRLFNTVDMALDTSLQLVAGFRGTGKSTEFSRLEKRLRESGYTVIRVDLDDYIDQQSPVDIRELLLILSGAIGDQVAADHLLGSDWNRVGFWQSVGDFLRQNVSLDGLDVDLGPISLKGAFKNEMSFRDRVRQALRNKVPRLAEWVWANHQTVVDALHAKLGNNPIVVIIDSFEHVRGDRENFDSVYRSVEELFLGYGRYLNLPDTHVIMSVHPFVALQADRVIEKLVNGAVQAWPACHVRHANGVPDQAGVDRMVGLVHRRGDWTRVLPSRESLEELILASGGYVRDMLRFMVECIHQTLQGGVRDDVAARVIKVVKRGYLPLFKDEIELLGAVARTRDLSQIDSDQFENIHRFLDAHLLLCYLNDDFWYDVHPMIKSELPSTPVLTTGEP